MANKILPDTCAWIEFFRGMPSRMAENVETALVQGEVVTCGVVLFELLQGIKNTREETLVLRAFQAVPQLEMTAALWIKAGQLSSQLRKKGHTLPLSDIIIATLALEHKNLLLTVDRHFDVIPGLTVIKAV
ncbi:MAG TPA: PIN domain-containing protein [Dongiaceae bacterium]|nr:PIN domain-containing protein [Dongiaceae bacterium]